MTRLKIYRGYENRASNSSEGDRVVNFSKDSFFDADINSIIQDIDKIPLKSSIQHVAKDNQVIQKPIQSKLAEFKMDPIESLLAQASTPSCKFFRIFGADENHSG